MLRSSLAPLALAALLPAVADAQDAWTRPAYSVTPQDEDWSGVEAIPEDERDWADGLKWMALDEDGDWHLTLGGHARGRVEGWSNFGQSESGNPRNDDVFLLGRVRAHADLEHVGGFRAYLELKSALVWDRELPGGTRAIDEDQLDIHQGFLQHHFDLDDEDQLVLRVGRQSLSYGRQRLISPLPWANTLRAWDGVLARYPLGGWDLDLFWTEFVEVDRDEFNEAGDDRLFGVYATRAIEEQTLDLYLLATERPDRAASELNGTGGDEDRYTLGARYSRPPQAGRSDFDVEVAIQEGDVGDQDIHAWMFGGELGYRLEGEREARVRALLEIGSGDSRAGGTAGTFDAPYPLGHGYYGIQDALGRQNVIDVGVGGSWKLDGDLDLAVTGHQFIRASDGDSVYRLNGMPIPGTTGGSSDIGQEIDVVLAGRFDRHTRWQAGYSRFFGGSVFDDAGAGIDEDTDFFYVQLNWAF